MGVGEVGIERLRGGALLILLASCSSGAPRADGAAHLEGGAAGSGGLDGGAAPDGADAPAPPPDGGPADRPAGDLAADGGGGDRDAASPTADAASPAGDAALPSSSEAWPSTIPIKGAALVPGAAGDPICYESGWCWSSPSPMGGPLAVWALAADDVWVVGSHGTTRHFDGQTWKNVPTPTKANLRAVWGAISTSVWATGDGVLLYWDGASWAVAGTSPTGHSLTGRNVADIWMAGGEGIDHWDGMSWRHASDAATWDMFELADGTVYTTSYGLSRSVLERLPGKAFTPVGTLPTDFGPRSVWAASATGDLWTSDQVTLLRHDRKTWQTVLALPGPFPKVTIGHVRGTGAGDVWAIGSDGTLLRWNGTGLERWPTGVQNLERLAARAPGDVWAAGGNGGLIHFEGAGWRRWFTGQQMTNVAAMAAVGGEIWAVGGSYYDAPAVTRFRPGAGWSEVGTAELPIASMTEVWGSAPDDVWMLGTTVPDTELIAHWDGAKWTPRNGPSEQVAYYSIWGAARDDVWVVGSDIIRWDGQGWKPFASPTARQMRFWSKVTGTSKNDVWLVGATLEGNQILLQWNGTSWIDHTTVDDAISLAERGPRDVFAWSGSTIRHFDGQQWKVIRTVGADQLNARNVSARAGELWTVLPGGAVDVWNGTAWTPSDVLGGPQYNLLATSTAVWAGWSYGGGIMRLAR